VQDIGVTNPVPYNASSLDTVILETQASHDDVESHWRPKERLISTDMPASASSRVNADTLHLLPDIHFLYELIRLCFSGMVLFLQFRDTAMELFVVHGVR